MVKVFAGLDHFSVNRLYVDKFPKKRVRVFGLFIIIEALERVEIFFYIYTMTIFQKSYRAWQYEILVIQIKRCRVMLL